MAEDRVADDETLYRAVAGVHYAIEDGVIRVSSQAFGDRERRPSVDRAHLRDNNPEKTRFDNSYGVVSLIASSVREIEEPINDKNGNFVEMCYADVEPAPEIDNPAHAQIHGRPRGFEVSKSLYQRMLARLCRISSRLLDPNS